MTELGEVRLWRCLQIRKELYFILWCCVIIGLLISLTCTQAFLCVVIFGEAWSAYHLGVSIYPLFLTERFRKVDPKLDRVSFFTQILVSSILTTAWLFEILSSHLDIDWTNEKLVWVCCWILCLIWFTDEILHFLVTWLSRVALHLLVILFLGMPIC